MGLALGRGREEGQWGRERNIPQQGRHRGEPQGWSLLCPAGPRPHCCAQSRTTKSTAPWHVGAFPPAHRHLTFLPQGHLRGRTEQCCRAAGGKPARAPQQTRPTGGVEARQRSEAAAPSRDAEGPLLPSALGTGATGAVSSRWKPVHKLTRTDYGRRAALKIPGVPCTGPALGQCSVSSAVPGTPRRHPEILHNY